MKKELLEQYAKLLAIVGINVEKGDEVWISAGLDQPEFVEMVVEECYKAGAKRVQVEWYYDPLSKLNYKYMTLGELGKVPPYRLARLKYSAKKLPSTLYIVSDDPDALKGVNVNKMAKARMKQYPKIKPYRDAMDGKYKWCIAGVPGLKWAKKIFPKLSDEEAIEALWEKILLTSRVDETNTVQNWKEHNDFLVKQSKKLHDLNLKYLYYKSNTGTDFKVELIPGINWGAGIEHTDKGKVFNPNIPTEEVFTSPLAGSCEGKLVATKPLSYQGQLIEDFYFVFKDGKVSEVHAKKNQEALEKMVKMDECASMLGEVALVPYSSPINQSGILFYETLYDENAVCHVALGAGFKELLPDGPSLTTEEAQKRGINDSMIHVDFMIGSPDLSIVGEDYNGNKIQIFKDGTWAI